MRGFLGRLGALGNLLHLDVLHFDVLLSAEHDDGHLCALRLGIDLADGADEALQRAVVDGDLVADRKIGVCNTCLGA